MIAGARVLPTHEKGGRRYFLVELPGFDDDYSNYVDTLFHIAHYLDHMYVRGVLLKGVIYLQRITHPRMGSETKLNLDLLNEIWGGSNFHNIVIATTMWDKVKLEDGKRTEEELCASDEYWKPILSRGSKYQRHDCQETSAASIIGLLSRPGLKPRLLNIQLERVHLNMSVGQTGAGRLLDTLIKQDITELRRRLKHYRKDRPSAVDLIGWYEKRTKERKQLKIEISRSRDSLDILSIRGMNGWMT